MWQQCMLLFVIKYVDSSVIVRQRKIEKCKLEDLIIISFSWGGMRQSDRLENVNTEEDFFYLFIFTLFIYY